MPHATLRAFTTGERRPAAKSTGAASIAQSQSSPAILGVGGVQAAATVSGNVGQEGVVASSRVNSISEDLLAREAELRDDFLRQVRWWRDLRYGAMRVGVRSLACARGRGGGLCLMHVALSYIRMHLVFVVDLGWLSRPVIPEVKHGVFKSFPPRCGYIEGV